MVDDVANGRDQLDDLLSHVVARRCLQRGKGHTAHTLCSGQGHCGLVSMRPAERLGCWEGAPRGLRSWHLCVLQPDRRAHKARHPSRSLGADQAPLVTAPYPHAQICQSQTGVPDSSLFFRNGEREQGSLRTDYQPPGNTGNPRGFWEIPEGHGLGETHNLISVKKLQGKKRGMWTKTYGRDIAAWGHVRISLGPDSNKLKISNKTARHVALAGYLMMWRNLVKCCRCDGGVVWFCRKTSLGRQLMKFLGVKCYSVCNLL